MTASTRFGASPTAAIVPLWVGLGLVGSLVLTTTGPSVGGGTVRWWFHLRIFSDVQADRGLFYAGMAMIAVAWLGLGRATRVRSLTPSQISLVAALWCLPLVVGVPLFSRDLYSYFAQGTIAHLGLSPYHHPPDVLARLGHGHVLRAVDPFWRRATAPYGPLFLAGVSVIAGLTGSHLVLGVILVRVFDLIGLVLLAIFVPRLARSTGADPARAVWLAVASPLVLFQLVAPGHNDLLMVGVMLAGISVALDGRPLVGIVVCALAATIKLPAAVAVVFLAVAWIRSERAASARLAIATKAAAGAIGAAAVITAITGFGVGWISTSLFSTPARVRLAVTPATDVSWTMAKLLSALGAGTSFKGVESVLRAIIFAVVVIIALVLVQRSRWRTVTPYLGVVLVAFAFGGPALWPWYLSWGLVLLAAWPSTQDSRIIVVGLLVGSFLVKPGGILALPLGSSPIVVGVWIVLAGAASYRWLHGGRRGRTADHADTVGTVRSVLAER
jgi:hypothetical protein